MTKDQWIKPHFDLEENEEKTNLPRIGTSKKRREFETEVANYYLKKYNLIYITLLH